MVKIHQGEGDRHFQSCIIRNNSTNLCIFSWGDFYPGQLILQEQRAPFSSIAHKANHPSIVYRRKFGSRSVLGLPPAAFVSPSEANKVPQLSFLEKSPYSVAFSAEKTVWKWCLSITSPTLSKIRLSLSHNENGVRL